MKKTIFVIMALMMALVLATSLVACTPVNDDTPCATHTYDNACDTTCNVCGATRNVGAHTDADTNGKCDICGAIVEIPPCTHTYDNACDTTCNTCGETRVVGDHVDADTNGKCDNCGADVDNGQPALKTDFTATEKQLIIDMVGEVVPFLPTYEYYVGEYVDEYGECILYYTYGNTQVEFEAYLDVLEDAGYVLEGTQDDEGDTWYLYVKDDLYIDAIFYEEDGECIACFYVYIYGASSGEDTIYYDFTAEEKQMFIDLIGEVIPFLYSSSYAVNEGTFTDGAGYVYFYTDENTETEFEAYLDVLEDAGYTFDGTEYDDYGDLWHYYSKGDILLDICFYEWDTDMFGVDVYVYLDETTGGGDIGGGSTGGGNTGVDESVDYMPNDGKGLPTGTNGVYEVDFNDATNVKNVTGQGYYLDGCPTTGNVKVLVIPVGFSDGTSGYDLAVLDKAFNSKDATDGIYSVYEYFHISSYEQLSLDFEIVNNWFRPQYESSYYEASVDADGFMNGDQLILDEALQYLATIMDLSEYDSDRNGIIDAVVLINNLEIGDDDFHWAYRYWNYYVDEDDYYYEYDGVSANDYLWASYKFMYEVYDEFGDVEYDSTACNTYTYIHEFSHILGADDYYDTSGINSPMDNADIMDSMFGDHNPYTKINYGWITSSRLVTTDTSVTLTLEDFSKNGDTIIIANNWDASLGAYQEYFILMYYTENGVNAGEDMGYFAREGIVVYHVNATLYKEIYDGVTYYDVFNNNTDESDQYGSIYNLIELVKSVDGTSTYGVGDTMPKTYLDNGDALAYNFVVDSINGDTATITITKSN